uniref:Uncharacterized protein n=1 Tax=Ixodes ricinus TaxID=34613 RepID=A0A6B0U6F1_IXORI
MSESKKAALSLSIPLSTAESAMYMKGMQKPIMPTMLDTQMRANAGFLSSSMSSISESVSDMLPGSRRHGGQMLTPGFPSGRSTPLAAGTLSAGIVSTLAT